MRDDIYHLITDRIIALLESEVVPWHQPWRGREFTPQNLITRKPYRGINVFLLNSLGFASPFWVSYRQASMSGGSVRKGEKACPVVFWKWFAEETDNPTKRRIPMIRYYHVFNVAQCENLTNVPVVESVAPFQPIEECERVVAGMPSAPPIRHGSARAAYWPMEDIVSMPDSTQFEMPESYYSVLFHELTHATGHKSRLARKGVTEAIEFGSDRYSQEELVAEMGAAFLCAHCGLINRTIEMSAGYIDGWLSKLEKDPKLVVHAAAQAQKACDFIRGLHPAEEGVRDATA